MDPLSLARVATAGKTIYGLSKEPQLHQILAALAADDVRAAARAIMDAEHSDHPEEELQHAITLLRQGYERYATRAQNRASSPAEQVGAALHRDQAVQARFRAAFVALAMASLYQMLDNEQQRECWQQVGSDDFRATYRSTAIVQQARDLVKMGGRSGQYGFYRLVRSETTQAAALEALRRKFERRRDSITDLRPLPESSPRLDLEAQMVGAPMKLPIDPWNLLTRDQVEASAVGSSRTRDVPAAALHMLP